MKNKRAFTLIELMIVICLISILSIIATPSISRYMINSKTKSTALDIYEILQQAKIKAISDGRTVSVEFGDGDNSSATDFSTIKVQTVTITYNNGIPTVTPGAILSQIKIDNRLLSQRSAPANGRVVFNSRGVISGGQSALCGSCIIGNHNTGLQYLIGVNIIGNITMRPTTT